MVLDAKSAETPNGNEKADLLYKRTLNRNLMLTFLPPTEKRYEKAPVYFLIPGGGWHIENRQSMIDFSIQSVEILRKEGFAVVSIDYRVCSDGAVMSEMITDCFDAARYVAHFADILEIDKERFVVSGHSAGAHLALMLSYAPQEEFQGDYEWNDTFCVKAVAVMSPPVDLRDDTTNNLRNLGDAFVGTDKGEKERTSPISYVTKHCPPTFLSAGTSDYLVFATSSEKLYQKLSDCGVQCKLLLSVGGGHCFEKIHDSIEPSVTMSDVQQEIARFMVTHIERIIF